MAVGSKGIAFTVTANIEAVPSPHELFPFTVMSPDIAEVP